MSQARGAAGLDHGCLGCRCLVLRLGIHKRREGFSRVAQLGRLVERGLHDELRGTAYAIADGVDVRTHHLIHAARSVRCAGIAQQLGRQS